MFTTLLTLILSCVCAKPSSDPWDGKNYAKHSQSQQDSASDFMQEISFEGSERVLDVGCGDGKITYTLAQKVPQGEVVGIDPSSSMIERAKERSSHQNNLTFFVQDAAHIQLTPPFDLITSFTVMHWVLEQEVALQGFHSLLRPGGKLWIQMPTGLPSTMQQALELTLAKSPWQELFVSFSPPWKFYQANEYHKLLAKAGFTPTQLETNTKHELFPSASAFRNFLSQWFPYLRPLTPEQKEAFLNDLLSHYFDLSPVDSQGRVSFIVERLNIQARK